MTEIVKRWDSFLRYCAAVNGQHLTMIEAIVGAQHQEVFGFVYDGGRTFWVWVDELRGINGAWADSPSPPHIDPLPMTDDHYYRDDELRCQFTIGMRLLASAKGADT